MEQPALHEKNLLAQHLYREWEKDPSKTLNWWSARWKVPLSLLEKWVKGVRRVGPAYAMVFKTSRSLPRRTSRRIGVSRVLYEQIVGRGLRGPKFGGTPTCTVIDCHDDIRGERPPLGYESFRRVWYGDPVTSRHA